MAAFVKCRCGKRVKTSEENRGKKGKCSQCGEFLSIPQINPQLTAEMFEALRDRKLDVIETLFSTGADVNALLTKEMSKQLFPESEPHGSGWIGESPLHAMASAANCSMIKFLLDCGAEINCRNSINSTPLAICLGERYGDRLEAIKLLLERGADATDPRYLRYAAQFLSLDIVCLFAPLVSDINARDADDGGNSILQAAMNSKRFDAAEVARILLSHGADPNAANQNGWTPLQTARESEVLAPVFGVKLMSKSSRMSVVARLIELIKCWLRNVDKQSRKDWSLDDYGRRISAMCQAGSDKGWGLWRHEKTLRQWGGEIDEKAGFEGMQEVNMHVYESKGAGARHELEKIWDGIGNWRS